MPPARRAGRRPSICTKPRERDSTCDQYHRVERGRGSFSRTFALPLPVDAERITADLHDGVLTITCPKAELPARRIDIS